MKTWYCVTSTYDDRGRVTAMITSMKADEKPESTFRETATKDIYTEWFGTMKEAEEYQQQCYKA